MKWPKAKLVFLLLALGVLGAALASEWRTTARLRTENEALRGQTDEMASLESLNEELSNRLERLNGQQLSEAERLELARLRGEVERLRSQSNSANQTTVEQGQQQSEAMQKLMAENRLLLMRLSQGDAEQIDAEEAANRAQCASNLMLIAAAKAQWGRDNQKTENDRPTIYDLEPYFEGSGGMPNCPDHGKYFMGTLREWPKCSVPGHAVGQ